MISSIEVPRQLAVQDSNFLEGLLSGYEGSIGKFSVALDPYWLFNGGWERDSYRVVFDGDDDPVRYITAKLMDKVLSFGEGDIER